MDEDDLEPFVDAASYTRRCAVYKREQHLAELLVLCMLVFIGSGVAFLTAREPPNLALVAFVVALAGWCHILDIMYKERAERKRVADERRARERIAHAKYEREHVSFAPRCPRTIDAPPYTPLCDRCTDLTAPATVRLCRACAIKYRVVDS